MSRNWIITGVSSGIGRALATAVLADGGTVVGTLRNPDQLAAFEALAPGRAIALQLDVTDRQRIASEVPAVIERLGHLDVLVNNAGYGINGALEEFADDEIDRCMATNYGGMVSMIRAVLPHMRQRRRGDIINFSSIAGFIGYPGMSGYSAAKFAVSGMSEALTAELAPFGIRVMAVEPGGFRTEFALGSLVRTKLVIEDYQSTPAAASRKMLSGYGGSEEGDPSRLAATLIKMLDGDSLPVHFVVGAAALATRRKSLERALEALDRWGELGAATDFRD